MLIEKEVIGPGTYWYTDQNTGVPRKLVVTPAETKYWQEQGSKMLSAGLTVPVPFEHDFNAHPMTPADRLLNNSGWVKEYRVKDAPDGRKDVLFSVLDIQDSKVAEKLPSTIRWSSPWFSSFTDGQGTQWNNVIAHLALTTRPRVTNQTPFQSVAAALSLAQVASFDVTKALGESFSLSAAGRLKQDGSPEFPVAFSMYSCGIVLADEEKPKEKKEDKKDDSKDYMSKFSDQHGDISMEELLADLLSALGIHLEAGGGEDAFKRALYNAAMCKIHELTSKPPAPPPAQHPPPKPGQKPNPIVQEQQPMYMSLEEINKLDEPLKSVALGMYNDNLKQTQAREALEKQLASLRDAKLKEEGTKRQQRAALLSMRNPKVKADLDAMLALPSMALSMGEGGEVLDPMSVTLAILEKGLPDMPRLLTVEAGALSTMAQPTDGEMSAQEVDALADSLSRQMGYPPEQKKAS